MIKLFSYINRLLQIISILSSFLRFPGSGSHLGPRSHQFTCCQCFKSESGSQGKDTTYTHTHTHTHTHKLHVTHTYTSVFKLLWHLYLNEGLCIWKEKNINWSLETLYLKGEFYNIKTHEEPPFVAPPFTVPEQQGYMFSFGLSDFTVNSALYGSYSAGVFQTLINDSVVSSPDIRHQQKQKSKARGFKFGLKFVFLNNVLLSDPPRLSPAPKYQLNGTLHPSGMFINIYISFYYLNGVEPASTHFKIN